ncbi:rhomboid family intramembrane serine protease [Halomarina salina]|uniref:Rhomboid family intramembrane serine protease n=1 Tax=Halomarina salina TaxID=1872699 RepID=A0ABD5RK63_9EURY|nr:rhomboid family intramembrane serine protease [Halomarina salina]
MGRLSGSPTVQTLALMLVVSLLYWGVRTLAGFLPVVTGASLFVLGPWFPSAPWTLVTSVYAHAGVGHLVANAITLAFAGLLLERSTTTVRYHTFFLATGILAGLSQVVLNGGGGVLGASGAIFALIGYIVTANPISEVALSRLRLTRGVQVVVFAVLAVVVTVLTGGPGVALYAHFAGLLVGLVAGRLHVLEPSTPASERSATSQYRV